MNSDMMPPDSYRYNPFTEEDFDREILQRGPFGETFDPKGFFLAFAKDELVGFIKTHIGFEKPDEENETIGFISPEWPWSPISLVVNPKHRNQGIGTALLNRGLEHLIERNVKKAQTSTDEKCRPRLRFLKKNGFKIWKTPHFMLENNLNRPNPEPIVPSGYYFKEFSLGNEKELLDACNSFFEENFKPRPIEGFVNYYEKSPGFDPAGFINVMHKNEIVGTVWNLVPKNFIEHTGRKMGFLEVLGVAREHRRKGLGRALVKKSLVWHKRKGMEIVGLMTDTETALNLYRKCGFEVTSTWRILRRTI